MPRTPRALNVRCGDTVTFVNGAKKFSWKFDTASHGAVPLAKIAPADFGVCRVHGLCQSQRVRARPLIHTRSCPRQLTSLSVALCRALPLHCVAQMDGPPTHTPDTIVDLCAAFSSSSCSRCCRSSSSGARRPAIASMSRGRVSDISDITSHKHQGKVLKVAGESDVGQQELRPLDDDPDCAGLSPELRFSGDALRRCGSARNPANVAACRAEQRTACGTSRPSSNARIGPSPLDSARSSPHAPHPRVAPTSRRILPVCCFPQRGEFDAIEDAGICHRYGVCHLGHWFHSVHACRGLGTSPRARPRSQRKLNRQAQIRLLRSAPDARRGAEPGRVCTNPTFRAKQAQLAAAEGCSGRTPMRFCSTIPSCPRT